MIATQAEKEYITRSTLDTLDQVGDPITCDDIVKLSSNDYSNCDVSFTGNVAYVSITGIGNFEGYSCTNGTKTNPNCGDTPYVDPSGANAPLLADGMVPVKWSGTAWVETEENDSEWYSYNDKNWANAMTEDGSMWVWIPRYIYKITSGWHSATTGTIEIQFTNGVNDNWNSGTIGSINTGTTSSASNNTWTNHPAFTFGSTELTGIWVAKFEATASEGVANSSSNCSTAGDNVSTKTVKILPNVLSWRCLNVGNMYTAIRNMETKTVYGWDTASGLNADGTYTTDSNGLDAHLLKNTEWGAIAYLSKSVTYGKGASEIYNNNNLNFFTACSGNTVSASGYLGCENIYSSTTGLNASSTGNISGIYDLSGGAWERLSAYVDNANANLATYGASIVNANSKYKNIYTKAGTDSQALNYDLTINSKGDAYYETSNGSTGSLSWFSDCSNMSYTTRPWVIRGNSAAGAAASGSFCFYNSFGEESYIYGFRPSIVVADGL